MDDREAGRLQYVGFSRGLVDAPVAEAAALRGLTF